MQSHETPSADPVEGSSTFSFQQYLKGRIADELALTPGEVEDYLDLPRCEQREMIQIVTGGDIFSDV